MKKLIALGMLLTSFVLVAGPKADLERANKLIAEKKSAEAVEVLKNSKNNVKGEEEYYEYINYILATQASKDEKEFMEYLKKASSNPKSTTQSAVQANILLVNNSKSNKDKIKYLEILNERINKSDVEVLAALASLYKAENENSKFNEIVKYVESVNKADITDNFNRMLGHNLLIGLNKENEGIMYLNKAANSKFVNIKTDAYLSYADYYTIKKDAKKVAEYLNAASMDKEKYGLIADRFLGRLGDLKTAYEYSKKAYNLTPSNKAILNQVFILAVANKDTKAENKYANLIKKEHGNIGVAYLLGNNGLLDASEKYAKLALKDSKTKKQAQDLLKQIEQVKKNQK